MESNRDPGKTSAAGRDFAEFMQRGDDFFKIELLRPARKWYTKALEMNVDPDTVRARIVECDRLIAFENRVILILGMLALAVLLVWVFV